MQTPRLLLRDWREEDRPLFAAMNADPRVMEFFPSPLTASESDAYLDRLRDEIRREAFGMYAIERRSDGEWLGMVGLHRISFAGSLQGKVEIGWRLRAEAWGSGYATEAAKACLEQAAKLGIERIYSFTTCANIRSQRVMERLEMLRLEEFDHPALPSNHPLVRHILYVK